jgi:heme/copper-type cytochrome/quinol oxidase subunit 4
LLGSSLENHNPRALMSSFSTYLIGFIVLIIGLAIAAVLVGVSPTWVVVGCIVLIGLGILTATTRTKTKDPPGPPSA